MLEIARTIGEMEIITTPSDREVLKKLSQTISFEELKKRIEKIVFFFRFEEFVAPVSEGSLRTTF